MKQPLRRGTESSFRRVNSWVQEFTGYRHAVDEGRINRWIEQFSKKDHDLVARLLDSVEFISSSHMQKAFKELLAGLKGWHKETNKRKGRWRFVAFSVSAGTSGDTMLYSFRSASGLTSSRYDELFIYTSELFSQEPPLEACDNVVFVDDFSATGDQACKAWPNILELLPYNPKVYLMLIRSTTRARKRICNETDFQVVPYAELDDSDNFFSSKCRHFSRPEKITMLQYCNRANKKNPRGYGDCGLVVVFTHKCPNNTIPVLHAHNSKWEGLFRRHD